MKRILIVLFTLAICSMSYARRVAKYMSQLQEGMTAEEVVSIMGKPESVSTINGCTYYNYLDQRLDPIYFYIHETWYYVRFIYGYVDSFGKRGDFDSTKDSKQTIDINVNTTTSSSSPQNNSSTSIVDDEVTRLKKLKLMLDEGLISQEEYDSKRKEILNSL